MFEKRYRKLHEKAAPEEALVADTVSRAVRYEARHRAPAWKRRLCAAGAIAACVFGGLPLAAASDAGYMLMHAVAPSAAQFFTPVRRTDEDQGIRMEVESAYIHGDTAEIHISFQDLDSDRIDATTDLYDSYSINRPFSSSGGCFPQGFDEESGKVRFQLLITEWGSQRIEGKKITFSVRELLCKKRTYDNIEIPLDLSGIGPATETTKVEYSGGDMPEGYDPHSGEPYEPYMIRVLEPGEPRKEFPVDGMALTGIGYIDSKLHIQTVTTDPSAVDNHGFFFLNDGDGNIVRGERIVYFRKDAEDYNQPSYQDHIFNVPQEELSRYRLYGWFQTGGELIQGNWRITFPLENAEK